MQTAPLKTTALLVSLLLLPAVALADEPEQLADLIGRAFVQALLEGNSAKMLAVSARQVSLEGTLIRDRKLLSLRYAALIARARKHSLVIKRAKVLSLAKMLERFGPPPKRLAGQLTSRDKIFVARFDRRGLILGLTRQGAFWRVKLLTD